MNRVLIRVDGSQANLDALKAFLAERRGSIDRVELLSVQPRLPRHVSRFLAKESRERWRQERAAQALEPARRLVESAGIACGTHTGAGPAARVVADTARLLGVNEAALGNPQRRPLERFAVPVGVGLAVLALAADD
jgi:hypothetical protein